MKRIAPILFFLIILNSCSENSSFKPLSDNKKEPIIIDIQPFDGIPESDVRFVHEELKRIFPNIQINRSIPLPAHAFYRKRARYRADTLIQFMRAFTPDGHVTIGLTHKDISHTNGKIEDFGIMGLAYQPGNSCIASTFRLSKNNKKEQLFKVAIHEFGHSQGIPHCEVKSCYMRDAEGKNPTNEETEFCPDCAARLKSMGWQTN